MLRPVSLLLLVIVLVTLAWVRVSVAKTPATTSAFETPGQQQRIDGMAKLRSRVVAAKEYIDSKHYNSSICFFIDMSMPSGSNRFFVYDLRKDSVRNVALVTHGRCNEDWLEGRKYGNTVGCGCTSLGKYRIGNGYRGRFGLAYKLHGLDKTNDKAFERYVVLHSHECVPATETTEEICQSDGCPTVSPGFLQYLKPIIEASTKPVLLWMYD